MEQVEETRIVQLRLAERRRGGEAWLHGEGRERRRPLFKAKREVS